MPRETQLDTHEIDKLLADEDFIDDFDFSQSQKEPVEQAAEDARDDPAAVAAEEGYDELFGETLTFASSEEREISAPASETMVSEVGEKLDQDDFELDFFTPDRAAQNVSRALKLTAGLLALLWFLQLGVVIWLLRKPPLPPAVRQTLEEIEIPDRTVPSPAPAAREQVPESTSPPSPTRAQEPVLYSFSVYIPIYSLTGLKVYSADLQIVQRPGARCLSQAEEEQLAAGLRAELVKLVGDRLYEEQSDLKERLEAKIKAYIPEFLQRRGRDLEKFGIRLVSSLLE